MATNTRPLAPRDDQLVGALQDAEQRAVDTQAALYVALQAAKREGNPRVVEVIANILNSSQVLSQSVGAVLETMGHIRKAQST